MASVPLRIGVLGAANIARQFIAAVEHSPLVTVTAVASRDIAKAKAYAAEVGVAGAFGSYDDLLADPAIEAIYNPLPNTLHAEWSIRAAEAGKHVLCEKPLCMSSAEAKAMFQAAKSHGVHLVEAYPYLAQPQTIRMRDLIRDGAIGKVRVIQASFGFTMTNPENIRLSPDLGGGARLDAGSYPISLVRIAAGERPARVCASADWSAPGVDRTTMALIAFPSGTLAQISCSFGTGNHRQALIAGDGGVITTTYMNHAPVNQAGADTTLDLQLKPDNNSLTPFQTITCPATNGFLAEAESFARLVAGDTGAWTGATPDESIDIMAIIEALPRSAATGTWVDLAA